MSGKSAAAQPGKSAAGKSTATGSGKTAAGSAGKSTARKSAARTSAAGEAESDAADVSAATVSGTPAGDTTAAGSATIVSSTAAADKTATDSSAAPTRPRHLASAVFVEGSEPLQRGMRYQLAVFGEDLCITGFINSLPDRQIFTRRVREVHTTASADRLVVAGASKRFANLHLVFDGVRDETARGLPAELSALWPAPDAESSAVT